MDITLNLLIFSSENLVTGYGSATALDTFIRAVLTHSDWGITLVIPSSSTQPPPYPSSRVRVVSTRPLPRKRRLAELLIFSAWALFHLASLRDVTPDVVIGWQPMPAGLIAWPASKLFRVPLIVRTCGPELARSWSRFPLITSVLKPLTHLALRLADTVVVKSRLELSLLQPFVAASRACLIPNAVGGEFFVTPRRREGPVKRLLTVCQLEPYKGATNLIAALGALGRRHPGTFRLTLVGDGTQRARLEEAAAKAGVEVDFAGRIPHSEMPELYASHDIFILPSALEGCSNAALEAMAAGLPVIGTRTALGDLIDDGVHGLLTMTPDRFGLEWAVERSLLLTSGTTRCDASRRRAGEHSPERLFSSYATLLEELCRSPRLKAGKP